MPDLRVKIIHSLVVSFIIITLVRSQIIRSRATLYIYICKARSMFRKNSSFHMKRVSFLYEEIAAD